MHDDIADSVFCFLRLRLKLTEHSMEDIKWMGAYRVGDSYSS